MTVSRRKVEAFAYQVSQSIAAAMNCSLAHVGDQLGLYQALSDAGPSTSDEFAERTGLHERWLREWLRHQACARQLEYDPITDRFSISEEAQLVLCDKDSPYYFASGFSVYNVLQDAVKHLPDAFRTGLGLNYDDHGPACASGIESLNNYVPRFLLISTILPELDGMCERLDHGIKVADVGCGAGVALIQMAEEYPNSEFLGFEISQYALSRARENLREANVSNVEIIDVNEDPLPDNESLDLVCTFDVVHDVPFPDRLLSDIRKALKPDGTWLCSDIRSFPTFEENLNDNPSAYLMYGFSMLVCMSSAMSEKNGAGLGTLGFNEKVAREMTAEAGFSRFRKLEYENATNSYYEIRP